MRGKMVAQTAAERTIRARDAETFAAPLLPKLLHIAAAIDRG
jgi:hypothetical protein